MVNFRIEHSSVVFAFSAEKKNLEFLHNLQNKVGTTLKNIPLARANAEKKVAVALFIVTMFE